MTAIAINYVELISMFYPLVYVRENDGGTNYDTLIHVGGQPIPSKEELDSKILEHHQNVVWERIKDYRDKIEENGTKVTIDTVDYWFHTDLSSLIKYAFLMILIIIAPTSFPTLLDWKSMSGVKVRLTPEILSQVFFACLSTGSSIFEISEAHKAAMLLEPNPYNYDFTTGWPPHW